MRGVVKDRYLGGWVTTPFTLIVYLFILFFRPGSPPRVLGRVHDAGGQKLSELD